MDAGLLSEKHNTGEETWRKWIAFHEWVDRAAKKGAQNKEGTSQLDIPLSLQERYHLLKRAAFRKFEMEYLNSAPGKISNIKENILTNYIIANNKNLS